MSERTSCTYVYIPADLAAPPEERTLTWHSGKDVEALLDTLKVHFRQASPAKTAVQRAAQAAELASKLGSQGDKVSAQLLQQATSMNLVESCYLLSHSRDTGFVGVNMYVDDEGSLKNLPHNVRASEIAKLCARPMQVRGDAFLARMLDDGDAFERQDFTLADLSSRAPWLLQARQQNEARQTQETPEAVMRRLQQEAQDKGAPRREIKELTPSEAARAEGNEAARKGDWKRAHAKYSESIELDRANLVSKNNRALASLRLELFEQAAQDASDVLEQEGDNVKALLRRAAARKGLNKVSEAVEDLDRVLRLEPKNADAAREKQGLLATETA